MTVPVLPFAAGREEAIRRAVHELRGGRLIVVPTDTVYGLAADAFNPFATAMIFQVKRRPRTLPLPVLVGQPRQAWALAARVPPPALALAAAFWPGALTLVVPEADGMAWDLGETGGGVAVRVPAHDDLMALLRRSGPLAVTSANPYGEPTPPSAEEAAGRLGPAISLALDGGPAASEVPSTIVDCRGPSPAVLREGAIPAAAIAQAASGADTMGLP